MKNLACVVLKNGKTANILFQHNSEIILEKVAHAKLIYGMFASVTFIIIVHLYVDKKQFSFFQKSGLFKFCFDFSEAHLFLLEDNAVAN